MSENKKRIKKIINLLNTKYKNPKTALHYKTNHQLLVATILSAQCTDKRVNEVTKDLFKKYKKVSDYAKVSPGEFEKSIRTTGFFRNKSKNIIAASKMIVEKFHSRIPDKMEKLILLPGVARKTANVILSEAFGKNEGIAVDTHVRRLSQRLSLSQNSNPDKIERDLMDHTAQNEWRRLSNLLISHGRAICSARNPKCSACILKKDCPSAFSFDK
ncbi:endonuclease III [Candidatus Parcubacteria bacterium]|nr:endonuclease III [Candidatus Parcubacteria bacterium]